MQRVRFDVFLSHNSADGAVVERIAERLRAEGIVPWLDRWVLRGGDVWQQQIAPTNFSRNPTDPAPPQTGCPADCYSQFVICPADVDVNYGLRWPSGKECA
jgi:hypothetical protein